MQELIEGFELLQTGLTTTQARGLHLEDSCAEPVWHFGAE
jgi:hypothetical protein